MKHFSRGCTRVLFSKLMRLINLPLKYLKMKSILCHKWLKNILVSLSLLFFISCQNSSENLTKFVDPFIGTAGTGHTFPGATLPFGMVQLSPDTRDRGWANCSGYHTDNPTILGFSHTHLSGTGAIDYGDILVMPTIGDIQINPGDEANSTTGYRSAFRHETEEAEPGYYAVTLDDYKIRAELTATTRTGFHRYTFPKSNASHIIFDLKHGLGDRVTDSYLKIIGDNEITGYRRSNGWARDQHLYFVAQFSKPFQSSQLALNDSFIDKKMINGKNVKGVFTFGTATDETILVKVGISAVDENGARQNLESESTSWNFDAIRQKASDAWEKELSLVTVKGGTEAEKTNFYTAIYHAFIAPNIFSDVDGRYRGADLNIHTTESGSNMYTVFSLWDTFRAAHPLFTLLKPTLAQDLIRTLISKEKEGDLLPVWELAGNETGTMIGYHSIPVITDAYVKGLRDFDVDYALKAMVESAMGNHEGLDSYKEKGYIPIEKENESVSITLEYAYDDWCIAVLADSLNQKEIADQFYRRSKNYLNLFNQDTGFMRGRKFSQWLTPFDPKEVTANYTEANSWQYSFFVPQDINGMINTMGGASIFASRLDDLFTTESDLTGRDIPDITGLIGQYAHGNDPSHNFAYLYNYVGQPWKTQNRTRQIMDEMYLPNRVGLCGNEDCGQMSAWYVFSAMGFYPVTPGQDIYALGTPIFDEISIYQENGKTFTIKAPNTSSDNRYVQSAAINGKAFSKSYITHGQITSGDELKFIMGNEPNKEWASNISDRPSSSVKKELPQNPVIVAAARAFIDSLTVTLSTINNNQIHFTLDGINPTENSQLYISPIKLINSTVIKTVAVNSNGINSNVEAVSFRKIPYKPSIKYKIPYNKQYTAGGHTGLFDTIRGQKHSWGAWQGWEKDNFEAVIDLGQVRPINSISTSFLQNVGSWIWLPNHVTFAVSNDGDTYEDLGNVSHEIPLRTDDPVIHEFRQTVDKNIRYIKIKAINIETCPDWHHGAGGPAWIFIDEIIID